MERFVANEKSKGDKDIWDKLDAASGVLTFVSALAIAAVGWWFTDGYKTLLGAGHAKREYRVTSEKYAPFACPAPRYPQRRRV